jgi:membrane-bound lytic murein transglycosylase B|tara:strand:- start:518 stop:1276 length:759 start_codon:yes stop_codon:yes gene_type:complete
MLINILILPFLFLYGDPVLDSIYDQAIKKGLPDKYLQQAFEKKHIVVHNKIPDFFARPYEKKSWEVYKKIFVTEKRISGGIKFYNNNEEKLNRTAVDPFIVLSIIGIESNYGLNKGKYSVFNALYTQILKMPKRSKWAQKELIDFLVLCYEDNIPPHSIKGSYAGAFGYGQFIPSSFISYAVDGNNDGKRKPYDWEDVIASISNYLIKNGYPISDSNDQKIYKSIYAYNHADNYVKAVIALSEEIKKGVQEG